MTAGCCRSLSTAASTERRAINAMAFLPRGRRKRRARDGRTSRIARFLSTRAAYNVAKGFRKDANVAIAS